MKVQSYFGVSTLLGLGFWAEASPLLSGRAAAISPVLNVDFPDPAILQDSGDKWYAYATAGNGKQVQVASASAPGGPWTLEGADALPDPGPWTTGKNTWAPDVRKLADNSYVMFYSGEKESDKPHHCVGTATSNSPLGPFTPSKDPLDCHLDDGGSIDPSGFYDESTGTRWIVYKIDGNSKGNGGDCNNGVPPLHTTPIILQQMSKDNWIEPVGQPIQILDRTDADGPLVEAPNLIRTGDGTYVLFYSSHCYTSPNYDVKYATARDIKGPYTRAGDPLIKSGDLGGLASPGGATSTPRGDYLLFHANCDAGRCTYATPISFSGSQVRVKAG